jgi:uncharacterized protein YjbJ (UPF0337 family)
MKFNIQIVVANLQGYLKKIVVGFSILTIVLQGVVLGVDPAIASPLFATSVDSISKQVTGKVEQMKGSAIDTVGRVQSAIEDKASDAKMKVKDSLTETRVKIDSNNARVENSADKATEKVKNFFGK